MKKIIVIILLILCSIPLTACSSSSQSNDNLNTSTPVYTDVEFGTYLIPGATYKFNSNLSYIEGLSVGEEFPYKIPFSVGDTYYDCFDYFYFRYKENDKITRLEYGVSCPTFSKLYIYNPDVLAYSVEFHHSSLFDAEEVRYITIGPSVNYSELGVVFLDWFQSNTSLVKAPDSYSDNYFKRYSSYYFSRDSLPFTSGLKDRTEYSFDFMFRYNGAIVYGNSMVLHTDYRGYVSKIYFGVDEQNYSGYSVSSGYLLVYDSEKKYRTKEFELLIDISDPNVSSLDENFLNWLQYCTLKV